MSGIRRRIAAGFLACAVLGAGAAAPHVGEAGAAPTAMCGGSVSVLVSAPVPGVSWAENVGFDRGGALWVSRTMAGVVDRYDARGRRTGSVAVAWPGAVRSGPDGRMYVTSGNLPVNMVPGLPRSGTVVAFDPSAARPVARTVARGLGMPNGLAFDARGAMYVADSAVGVVRIVRGRIDPGWTVRAPRNLAPTPTVNGNGMNGIVIRGETAYVTMATSLTGRVLRVPLKRPERHTVAADLTAPLPGLLDDGALVGQDRLAVATTTGQVIVTDLRTGSRCVVGVGQPATSVAVHPGGGLVVGTELGDVLRVR